MGPICPECQTGKHENCDGVGGLDSYDDISLVPCMCQNGEHPHRMYFLDEAQQPILDGPPDEGSIWGEAFPELVDDHYDIARLAPQRELITDLMDVEVMNSDGEWVPMIPLPLYLPFWLKQCHCGKRFWTKQSYMEHYAYRHILGMEK